jgi:hypothetical protein
MGLEMGTLPMEYSEAMRSVRAAKNIFWWLIILAVVVQIAIFVLMAFGGVLDALPEARLTATQSARGPATSPSPEAQDNACRWRTTFTIVLAVTEFMAMAMGILLALSLLLAVNVALTGRLGGLSLLISAFFWSLVLLLLALIPWGHVFKQSVLPGALFRYEDLCRATCYVRGSWGAVDVTWTERLFYYGRFLAYPVLVVLIALLVDLKFCRGCRKMIVSAATPPMR